MNISYKGVNITHRTVQISPKHGVFLNKKITEIARKFRKLSKLHLKLVNITLVL